MPATAATITALVNALVGWATATDWEPGTLHGSTKLVTDDGVITLLDAGLRLVVLVERDQVTISRTFFAATPATIRDHIAAVFTAQAA